MSAGRIWHHPAFVVGLIVGATVAVFGALIVFALMLAPVPL